MVHKYGYIDIVFEQDLRVDDIQQLDVSATLTEKNV